MTTRKETLHRLLSTLSPTHLQIDDQSALHKGHSGIEEAKETHFAVVIVAEQFAGKSKVERHRLVYRTVEQVLEEGLHALALETLTPEEFSKK